MKKCPQCGREYDNTMSFCLDDGEELLYGPVAEGPGEAQTAILQRTESPRTPVPAATRSGDPTAVLPSGVGRRSFDKRLLLVPLALAAIALAGFWVYRYLNSTSGAPTRSIAVLPFANATNDREIDFLADGIAETLINNFTKIADLKVAARASAFSFRGREGEPKVIGNELGVDSVLAGRLTQRGDQLSIQVDLINATDGAQIWGNRYEGKPSDLVSIQERIATDVASQLKLTLTGTQARQVATTYTQNPEAYRHYLRGRYHWNKRTPSDLKTAVKEFQAAADLDPTYPLAFVGLADATVVQEEYVGTPSSEVLPKARSYIEKALAIDGSIGEAYATLGLIESQSWRWEEADRNFEKSIALNPNYPTAHHWYCVSLRERKLLQRAQEQAAKAHQLDPLSNIISINVAILQMIQGNRDATFAELNKTLQLDPDWYNTHYWIGIAHLHFGEIDRAIASLEKSVELNRSYVPLAALGHVYGIAGREADARRIIAELEKLGSTQQASPAYIASVYVGLAENDQAFELLERAFENGDSGLARITWFPPFRPLREDPRFKSLVQRMNMPQWSVK